jgi:hypothetical protein
MEKRDGEREVPMKKIISVLVLLLISATTLSNYATSKIYLPIAMKSKATPTPYVTLTPTPYLTATPTSTPFPGAPPEVTYFTCNYLSPYLYCYLDVKNVGGRPISNVAISIYYDSQFARELNSGSSLIQPGDTYSFSWNDRLVTPPNNVSASIDSWVEH